MLIRFLLAALLAFLSPFASAQTPSLANSGVVTIGTRAVTGSFGDLNVGDYGADFGKTLQTAISALNPGGGGGGRSGKTRLALIDLMRAIEADNADTPSLKRPEQVAAGNV